MLRSPIQTIFFSQHPRDVALPKLGRQQQVYFLDRFDQDALETGPVGVSRRKE